LPENLIISDTLYLWNSGLEELPKILNARAIRLDNSTKLKTIPSTIKVKTLDLRGSNKMIIGNISCDNLVKIMDFALLWQDS
jgi:hypothetical protein